MARLVSLVFVVFLVFLAGDAFPELRLRYVTTARQKGPVGHRDPIGVLSPDGRRVAYSEGRFVKVQHVEGGAVSELEPLGLDVREIAWLPDSKRLAIPDRAWGGAGSRWYVYDLGGGRKPLWPDAPQISQLSWASDGTALGVVRTNEGFAVVRRDADGRDQPIGFSRERLSQPLAHGDRVSCIAGSRLRWDCGDAGSRSVVDREVYGPFAYSPGGDVLYFSSPNENDTLDLWSLRESDGELERLTQFARDTYAPSVDEGGRVLFKVQDYRTFLAMAPAEGGETEALTTFQSETPSWDATSGRVAFTFGNWRRVLDDLHYPDISQHVGFIRLDNLDGHLPAEAPHGIVSASTSEDQGQAFSPDGKWIAFHSHYGPS
ncbi:MAG TPA: hypothetical protein VJ921_06230, partial [Vicinamibacteria bacterium]|nr:hypothetical protein [Vicinamibacteria bacterium]